MRKCWLALSVFFATTVGAFNCEDGALECLLAEVEAMRARETPRVLGSELDPPELPPRWWTKNLTSAWWRQNPASSAVTTRDSECARASECRRMTGEYGRTGNSMIEFANNLKNATFTEDGEPPMLLQLSDAYMHFFSRDVFAESDAYPHASVLDVDVGTRAWACVTFDDVCPFDAGYEVPAKLSFKENSLGIDYDGWIYAQLLLRPSLPVRFALEYLRRRHGLEHGQYVGVHLRHFEGKCEKYVGSECLDCKVDSKVSVRRRNDTQPRDTVASDICDMPEEYLDAALEKLDATGVPVYLAHDGQQPDRVKAILERYEATVFDQDAFLASPFIETYLRNLEQHSASELLGLDAKSHLALFVDLLMLIRSKAFIGNRGSSLSYVIQQTRRAFLGRSLGWQHSVL